MHKKHCRLKYKKNNILKRNGFVNNIFLETPTIIVHHTKIVCKHLNDIYAHSFFFNFMCITCITYKILTFINGEFIELILFPNKSENFSLYSKSDKNSLEIFQLFEH